MTDGSEDVIVATRQGMAIRFRESDVRPMGRTARGVKVMSLKDGDEIVGMTTVKDNGLILTVSETGYGRLSDVSNYRVQSRGGKGLKNYHVDKYGAVAALSVVSLDDDIILISDDGVIIRIEAKSIRICARPSKGVTVMKLKEGSRVVTLAAVPHDENEETTKAEDDAEEIEEDLDNE